MTLEIKVICLLVLGMAFLGFLLFHLRRVVMTLKDKYNKAVDYIRLLEGWNKAIVSRFNQETQQMYEEGMRTSAIRWDQIQKARADVMRLISDMEAS